jgi:hypothetical protein
LKITDRKFLSAYESLFEKNKPQLEKMEVNSLSKFVQWCANQGKPEVERILQIMADVDKKQQQNCKES